MDRWLIINVLTAAVVVLAALNIVTAAFKITNKESLDTLLFGACYGGAAGFALGLYYYAVKNRKTHGEKN